MNTVNYSRARSLATLVMTDMRRSVVALVMTAIASAPLAAQGASQLPAIPEARLIEVGKSVKSLSVEPRTVTLKVGEKLDLNRLFVTVFDSAGHTVGRLAGYDFSIPANPTCAGSTTCEPASVVPRVVTGDRPGTTELVIRYPRNFWKRPDARAETKVKVVVTK